jgi:uncharacterized protein (TIGR02246 family)
MKNFFLLLALTFFQTCFAIETEDRKALEQIIANYVTSWNKESGKGFGDGFSNEATFVNIFGMEFFGKNEIETRHVDILSTFLKDTSMEVTSIKFREVNPTVVIALVRWELKGHPAIQKGIFTHTFVRTNGEWKMEACQNTLCKN